MVDRLRSFDCPVTDERCDDPRCKRTRCIYDIAADALALEQEKAHAAKEAELRPTLEKVAREFWRIKKVRHPSPDQMNRAMAHSVIRDEAKRRFTDHYVAHWSNLPNSN